MKTFANFGMNHAGLVSGLRRAFFYVGLIALLACFPGLREAAAQTWEQVSSMSVAREQHTATLLADGRALIAGGYMPSTELFDPQTASWTTTAPLSTNRYQATATLLANGRVLVAGGMNYPRLASALLFDPATSTWIATGSMSTAHDAHTATLLANGKVLVAGGWSGTVYQGIANADVYDPTSGTWTATAPMLSPRMDHTATLLPNGKVLVAGGYHLGTLSSSELYDPAASTWTATGPMTTNRDYHTATLLTNGKVLIAGGGGSGTYSSAELFDPATSTWSAAAPMNVIRMQHTATLLRDGRVLVAGGFSPAAPQSCVSATEIYDPTSGTWSPSGNLVVARYFHTATLLTDGTVLVTGGATTNGVTSSAELFLPGPVLRASTSGGNLTLTWPATNGGAFHLQTASTFLSTNWADADDRVVTTNGMSQAVIPMNGAAGFYRLKQ